MCIITAVHCEMYQQGKKRAQSWWPGQLHRKTLEVLPLVKSLSIKENRTQHFNSFYLHMYYIRVDCMQT